MSNIALFDMDGTIADYDSKMRSDLSFISGDKETMPEELHGDIPQHIENRMDLIKNQSGWWANLPVIPSGMLLLHACIKIGFDIHILTQGPKRTVSAWSEKLEWCEKYVAPIIDYGISITREGKGRRKGEGKGLHYGKVFVDDYPPYMLAWLEHRPRGLGLMPVTVGNKDFTHPQVFKYRPSDVLGLPECELMSKLQQAYDREAGEE